MGRVNLDLVSHIPAHHWSTGCSCFPGTEISNKKTIMHKNKHHRKLCKILHPPQALERSSFMPTLFCFCLIISQLGGGGAAQTGSPLYGCTKPGMGGLQGLGENCSSQNVLQLLPHGPELWQPLDRTPGRAGEGTVAWPAPGTAGNAPGCSRK